MRISKKKLEKVIKEELKLTKEERITHSAKEEIRQLGNRAYQAAQSNSWLEVYKAAKQIEEISSGMIHSRD